MPGRGRPSVVTTLVGGAVFAVACLSAPPPAPLRGTATERAEGLARLLEIEDRRDFDASVAGRLAASPDAWLRARLAWTCGRLRDPEASPFLTVLLRDPDASVRGAAAFGMGLAGDARLTRFLVGALSDDDPEVASYAAEALGKLGGEEAIEALLRLAAGPGRDARARAAEVRPDGPEIGASVAMEARPDGPGGGASGPADAEADASGAAALALFRSPSATVAAALGPIAQEATAGHRLRRAALYSLSRRPVPEAAPALRRALEDPQPELVAWAARGLGVLADLESVDRLVRLARHEDPSVAVQAIGALEKIARKHPSAAEREAVGRVALDRAVSEHAGVAVSAIRLLGRVRATGQPPPFKPDGQAEGASGAAALLSRLLTADGWRARVAVTSAVLLDNGGVAALPPGGLARLAASTSPIALRLGAADALGVATAEALGETLPLLLRDPSARVRSAALASAGVERLPAAALAAALGDTDASVVATAIELAAPVAGSEPALSAAWDRAYERLLKEPEADFQVTALEAAAAATMSAASFGAGGMEASSRARERILARVDDPEHVVREKARRLAIEKLGVKPGSFRSMPVLTRLRRDDYIRLARLALERELTARVSTTRGDLVIELACEEAPMTADSFRALADRRFFDNVSIHRVVPDFVVQAGDPRGDGTGGPGYSIRDEINPLRYERGALGMALSGPDTGGSQWFVTLAAQPHLDGGYTVFGRVVSGMEVVDRIEQDDQLLSVRVEESARRRPLRPPAAGPRP